jgi:hypothetical protein
MLVFRKETGSDAYPHTSISDGAHHRMDAIYHPNRCDYITESRASGWLYLQQEEKPTRGTALQ